MTTPEGLQSDPVFEANPKQVSFLIQKIFERELALPDFQRDFVWEPGKTAELLRTVMSRHPAGSLLFWRTGAHNTGFAAREVEGAPKLTGGAPAELILDGQQRLTALFQAITGTGDELFYIDLRKLLNDEGALRSVSQVDWDQVVSWFGKKSRDGATAEKPEWQFENRRVPVQKVRQFDEWLDGLLESGVVPEAQQADTKKSYRLVRERFLRPLESYGFPVITLPESTSLDAVCTVFETLNRTGKPLGAFELLTARFYKESINLRDLWAEATQQFGDLERFQIDPYSVLQVVSLRSHSSAQRSDVLNRLKATHLAEHWPKSVAGVAGVLNELSAECGVLSPAFLPYSMVVVPMAAVWHEIQQVQPLKRAKCLARLRQFFWCSVFMTNYDQGANSQAGADYTKLKAWIFDPSAAAPEAVSQWRLSDVVLKEATVRRKALFNGIMSLSVKAGAQDFHTAQRLTLNRIQESKIDSHHLFPRAFLRDSSFSESPELILNRALIDPQTNKIISDQAPSKYIETMRTEYGEERLATVLESHMIPLSIGGGLESNDYLKFLSERLERIVQEIEGVTELSVERSSNSVPGESLV